MFGDSEMGCSQLEVPGQALHKTGRARAQGVNIC